MGLRLGLVRSAAVPVPVSVSGATGCSRQDQSARHGQNKMYANGLINYEISSVGYVRLLKGSTDRVVDPPPLPWLLTLPLSRYLFPAWFG